MHRRSFLGSIAAAAAPTSMATAQARQRRPNILFILADDLGYGNLGCYGGKQISTPNIDRLAAEGTRFTQAYAGSTVCAPSRCCLMTGFHTGHARTRGNKYPDLPLRPSDVTVTEILKNSGYRTGLFGKWSLGQLGSSGYPTRKGFEEWFGFFSQTHAHNFYPEHLLDGETAYLLRGNFGAKKTEYAHDLFTDRALKFIEKKDQRPFFLKLAYTIPHANNELGRDTGNGMEVPDTGPYTAKDWPAPDKGFAAMVTHMDRGIGQILNALKLTGQDENTIIFFSSDNGPHREGGHNPDFFDDNGPLRGIKRDLYEGGIRVPMLVHGPGRIPAGRVSDQVWAFWDFLPTAAELAGVPAPAATDGISMVPTLTGKGTQRQHDYLYWEFHERGFQQAIRRGNWKAVRPKPGARLELYDLASDVGETKDVAASNLPVIQQMEALFAKARTASPEWPLQR
jgi:arylsulfatase A-like enzyme